MRTIEMEFNWIENDWNIEKLFKYKKKLQKKTIKIIEWIRINESEQTEFSIWKFYFRNALQSAPPTKPLFSIGQFGNNFQMEQRTKIWCFWRKHFEQWTSRRSNEGELGDDRNWQTLGWRRNWIESNRANITGSIKWKYSFFSTVDFVSSPKKRARLPSSSSFVRKFSQLLFSLFSFPFSKAFRNWKLFGYKNNDKEREKREGKIIKPSVTKFWSNFHKTNGELNLSLNIEGQIA